MLKSQLLKYTNIIIFKNDFCYFTFLHKMSIEKHYKNDTKILMADGSIKTIDSIIVGDFVMGPNDTCKKVIETNTIQSDIVKITPNKGYSFICSDTTMMSMTGIIPYLVVLKP